MIWRLILAIALLAPLTGCIGVLYALEGTAAVVEIASDSLDIDMTLKQQGGSTGCKKPITSIFPWVPSAPDRCQPKDAR